MATKEKKSVTASVIDGVKQAKNKSEGIAGIVDNVISGGDSKDDSEEEDTRDRLADDEVVLLGEVLKIKPLVGKDARIKLPQLISLGTELIGKFNTAEVDITSLLDNKDDDKSFITILFAAKVAMEYLAERVVELENVYFPFIMGLNPADTEDAKFIERLNKESKPLEVWIAVIRACIFHWKDNTTSEVMDAYRYRPNPLKNGSRAAATN